MANAVSKIALSGSTAGKGILLAATATPGTSIHVTGAVSTVIDEIWLYAINMHTADVLVTIEFGGVTSPGFVIAQTVPFKSGLYLLVPGLPLVETGGALTVAGFAGTTNVVSIFGFVNKITP